MSVQVLRFNGFLNTDDEPDIVVSGQHTDALNGVFRGNPGNYRFQNVVGNELIVNPNLPSGSNECIGSFYDNLRQRIYWFNYNSNAHHGIYYYDLASKIIYHPIILGTNGASDALSFNLNNPIFSAKVLYGDDTQGDTLFFLDSNKLPRQINIKMALAGSYGTTILKQYLDVIKAPASRPPQVVYQDDSAVKVNNLRKKLFKFKQRFVYENNEKSVFSTHSEVAIPVNYLDTNIDKDPTKNVLISIVFQTGPANVRKIEIAGCQNVNNVWGDFFSIQVLDKTQLGLADNDIATFRFYNDQAYVPLDVTESIQPFDTVPLEANDLELLNGNVLIYGGIKEGYNKTPLVAVATAATSSKKSSNDPFIFEVSQSGDSGFGTGNIHVIVIGKITSSTVFKIATTNYNISYTAGSGATSNTVITNLRSLFIGNGFTVISSNTENLVVVKNGQSLLRSNVSSSAGVSNNSLAYDYNSTYGYAIAYFDGEGRTPQAIIPSNNNPSSNTLSVQTINYASFLPQINISISSRPPLYAKYFQILRTKNKTKDRTLYWVTDRTFKDTTYAYISIESLNAFIAENPTAVIGYNFLPGDRIRFIKNLSITPAFSYTNQDFEIIASVINPTINGVVQNGQFLKMALPSTNSDFDFGGNKYENFFINLYTPAKSVGEGLEEYYEFGERYSVGNAGTNQAFHQGQTQNQTPNLLTPALFSFIKGDDYARSRSIYAGNVVEYEMSATDPGEYDKVPSFIRTTLKSNLFDDSSVYFRPNITLHGIPASPPLVTPPPDSTQRISGFTDDQYCVLRVITSESPLGTTFRVKGNVLATVKNNSSVNLFRLLMVTCSSSASTTSFTYYELYHNTVPELAGQEINAVFDQTVTVPVGYRMFIMLAPDTTAGSSEKYQITAANYKITDIGETFTVDVIDQNFSDFFASAVNSNGRSWVIDPNAAQVYSPTLVRWSRPFEINSNVNGINRFFQENLDVADISKGAIQRLHVRGRSLYAYQETWIGVWGIYGRYIQNSGGSAQVVTTDEIITSNNIQYLNMEGGLGSQPTGLIIGQNADYFVYPVTGELMRRADNGITNLSETYKGQYNLTEKMVPYNLPLTKTNGAKARILGYFDIEEKEARIILPGGTNEHGEVFSPYTFSFNEKRNAFSSSFSFNPEWMVCAQKIPYSFKQGQLWIHKSSVYCNFFGVQYPTYVEVVFNKDVLQKKTWISLTEFANAIWECPAIKTQLYSYGTANQQSELKTVDFAELESEFSASFLKDSLSSGGINNGSSLKGGWIKIKFQITQANSLNYLSIMAVNYVDSPENKI